MLYPFVAAVASNITRTFTPRSLASTNAFEILLWVKKNIEISIVSLASFINGVNDDDSYYRQYEFNGSISASVNIENVVIDDEDILYAYSNGNLRGKNSPTVFPLTGELVFTLMVYGNGSDNEKLNFELYDNELTGTIPETIGNLTNLNRLYMSENQLTGEIPEVIGNLSN